MNIMVSIDKMFVMFMAQYKMKYGVRNKRY